MPSSSIMNRLGRKSDFGLRTSENPVDDDDEERLYERQALIFDNDDDNNDICDDEINSGQVSMRYRQQSDRDKQQTDTSNGYELKSYNTKPYRDNNGESGSLEFTYYDIKTGDSLQSICLRYACPINQVKRLNGLITDQDFYGLRRLKLPLGKLGLLEDLLKQQNGSQDLLMLDESRINQNRPRLVNSPGSALSVTGKHNNSRFKPLLSPGYSSDRIDQMNRSLKTESDREHDVDDGSNGQLAHNSHSFSSLREFATDTTSINISNSKPSQPTTNGSKLAQQSFIKSEIVPDSSQVTIDNLLTDEQPVVTNVFEDLDYHVERAKVAAESYEQRAAELVSGIEATNDSGGYLKSRPRPSRIPELFFSGENFGLNIKRLVMLIVFVCLVIPLVYISQANVVK